MSFKLNSLSHLEHRHQHQQQNNNNNRKNNNTQSITGSTRLKYAQSFSTNKSKFIRTVDNRFQLSSMRMHNSERMAGGNNHTGSTSSSSSLSSHTNNNTNNAKLNYQPSQAATTTTTTHNSNTSHYNMSGLASTMMPSVASRLKKNIARTKEKFLVGIGKTDRTSDDEFNLYVDNFELQHSQAHKLTKELNRYLNCLRETHKASRIFYETLRETYEPNWPNSEMFNEQILQMEDKWSDYTNKLSNEVQLPLISYLNEFPELKKKIEKRGNRLLDYDDARHTLESNLKS
jgi:hypothetical protein